MNTTESKILLARMHNNPEHWVRMLISEDQRTVFLYVSANRIALVLEFLTIILFSVIPRRRHHNECYISIFCFSSRNPQKSLIDFVISLDIPMLKNLNFRQQILLATTK